MDTLVHPQIFVVTGDSMSRILLVFSVVSFTLSFSSNTTLAQCDASPQTCGCTAEINECGNGGRLFNSLSSCNEGNSLTNGSLGNLGAGDCKGNCGSGLSSIAPNTSCGCSGGSRRNGGFLQGLLPRVNVSVGQGQPCAAGHAPRNKGGLCGLFTDITGISASITRNQTGCNCGGASPASACDNGCGPRKYIKLMAGWNLIEDDDELDGVGQTNDGFLLGFARGRRLNRNTRFEFESSWRNNSGNFTGTTPLDGRVNVFSPTVNLYRDFGTGPIRPYIGGGIGIAFQDAEFVTGEIEDEAFAYQGAVGLAWNSRPGKDWFIEYRYYGNTDTDLEFNGATIGDVSYEASNVIFGFRESF